MTPKSDPQRYEINPSMLDEFARPSWMLDALCREYPQVSFFPAVTDRAGVAAALAVCGRCAVMAECGAFAITERLDHGVFGGMSEQLRAGRRRLAAKRSTTTKEQS